VVVADKESPRDGRFIETIGHYNPRTDPPTVVIKADRALYWLSKGAQPSDPVARMLKKQGILAQFEAYKRGEPLPTAEELAAAAEAAEAAAAEAAEEPEVEAAEAEVEEAAEAEAEVEEVTEAEAEVEAEEAEAEEAEAEEAEAEEAEAEETEAD
jgi:small subunit ribosomal protein S16